jgi:serine/threonine-protein kinase
MKSIPPAHVSIRAPSIRSVARPEKPVERYLVKGELASGGMGVVYRVLDRSTNEERALKRMKSDGEAQPFLVEAFEREYQVLAGLDHPRIIRVFDYGVDELGPYYTMELLEGQDMRAAGRLPFRDACLYLRDVATSLALLHARRLIHRDLSPTNVRMTADGHCKLLDFGALAAFGYSRLVVGTPPGIPPEALGTAPLDQRADLYALGALAYWMLTGHHAYPAKEIAELEQMWLASPRAPSETVEEIPAELDILVLSLLSGDPLARPASAAEVIARLTVIGELPAEDHGDAERLAQSFLLSPRFIGRSDELHELRRRADEAVRGRGGAVRIEAIAGMGRTRFLEEIGVRAQLAGASVLRVDASMYRHAQGTARALAIRALDAFPQLARECGVRHRAALAVLGHEVEARLPARGSLPPGAAANVASDAAGGGPEAWFAEISRTKPLVIEVDNVEYADAASLGLLAALAKISGEQRLLVVVTERVRREPPPPVGLVTLRGLCSRIELSGLGPGETLELARSLFGDAPSVERYAEWLHGRTAGSPLHCVEISRQLVAKQIIRYHGGMWMLPVDRPDAALPSALEDALSIRIASLSLDARGLVECLSLQREQPTIALCRELVENTEPRYVLILLDELARNDVLYADQDGYRFSSTALREALLGGMSEERREQNHARLGAAFAVLAGPGDHALKIEAGWHLIKGGDETDGADTIAAVTHDSVTVRTMIANLHHAGRPIEAALAIYKRQRRSASERMPLLAALAHAGYYEDRAWGEKYGDEALDVLEDLSGLGTARRLRRFTGRPIALAIGIFLAFLRFYATPKGERHYSFASVLVQLFGAVTTLTGAASLSFDIDRAARVAKVLEPFSFLPDRMTPVGIYQFCLSLQQIGQEHTASAMLTFETMIRRFEDPRYYPTLPDDARLLYRTGAHFARGAFAVMRNDGSSGLESADALDASGLKLYSMIASQLRFLYHANRGEFALAAAHRDQVELHAAHVGSAWQVETWEAPALTPVHTTLSDVVALTRITDRLELLSKTVPSLKLHFRLARQALSLVRKEGTVEQTWAAAGDIDARPPRSFIGWATTYAFLARGLNGRGDFAAAKKACERALAHITDVDREYVTLFLAVDIEMAFAEAGLGDVEAGLGRIDALLELFRQSDHPLVRGGLHEARARIAWAAHRRAEYDRSLSEVERWYRPTGTPALISKVERLAELASGPKPPGRPGGTGSHTGAVKRPAVPVAAVTAGAAVTAAAAPVTSAADREAKTVRTLRQRREPP